MNESVGYPRETNPLRNDNKLQFGIFSTNGTGTSFTTHPDRFTPSWERNVRVAQMADDLGIEAMIAFSRYKPYVEDDTHYSGRTLDCMTWAAGLAAVTKRTCLMATVHPLLNHPILMAKAAATVDIISNGRLGLNIVAGWHTREFEMFDVPLEEHDLRYDIADEWMELFERTLVAEDGFDFDGKYFHAKRAYTDPKPVQRRPVIMNAGGSERGRRFTARNSDVAFIQPHGTDPELLRKQVEQYRAAAREYGREFKVWMNCYMVQRDSRAEAEAYVQEVAGTYGDVACADGFIKMNVANAQSVPKGAYERLRFGLIAGAGGYPLLGNAEDITAHLKLLSEIGFDGLLLGFVKYEEEIEAFGRNIMPRLVDLGLRRPDMAAADIGTLVTS